MCHVLSAWVGGHPSLSPVPPPPSPDKCNSLHQAAAAEPHYFLLITHISVCLEIVHCSDVCLVCHICYTTCSCCKIINQ